MKKLIFALLSLVLTSSIAWGQAEQKAVKEDSEAEGTSPDCDKLSGTCTGSFTGRAAARPSQAEVVKTVERYSGTGVTPKQDTPAKSESTK